MITLFTTTDVIRFYSAIAILALAIGITAFIWYKFGWRDALAYLIIFVLVS